MLKEKLLTSPSDVRAAEAAPLALALHGAEQVPAADPVGGLALRRQTTCWKACERVNMTRSIHPGSNHACTERLPSMANEMKVHER